MEPQESIETKRESTIYVQQPDGKEMNVKEQAAPANETPESARQTADNVPTQASSEVTDGEDA